MEEIIKLLNKAFIEVKEEIKRKLENNEKLDDYEIDFIYKILKATRKINKEKAKGT